MHKKTLIFLIIIIFISSLIIVFLFYSNKDKTDIEVLDYYGELTKKCEQKQSYDCCISSVEIIAEKNYKLVSETGCPEGYQINSLRCVDSFQWCEEIIEKTIEWKIYKNKEYGFEFKHPDLKNWQITEESQEEKLLKMDIFNLKTENYDFNIGLSVWDLPSFDRELFELHNFEKGQYRYDYKKGTFHAMFPGTETEIDSIDAIADIARMPLIRTKDNLRVLTFQNASYGSLRIDYWIFNIAKDMVASLNFVFMDDDVLIRSEPLREEEMEEKEIIIDELKETINQIISTFSFL